MEMTARSYSKSRFPYIYEGLIWLIYVCLYKYDYYLQAAHLPVTRENFPYVQLMGYAIGMTLYIIPFYRWLAPLLLRKKRHVLLFFLTLFYFEFVYKLGGWLVSLFFHSLDANSQLAPFYKYQYTNYGARLLTIAFWDLRMVLTDLVAFLSLTFLWYAFEVESKKHLLEKDNLVLQLESLKAQLHPHFLFNTLNSIYGMSLTGSKDTPAFILRLSNMMRYMLYDCRNHHVPLEKDVEFLDNYLEMEKKRYPEADIQFTVTGDAANKTIAPLLFIPFIENSFKHGSHRLTNNGFIHGSLRMETDHIIFTIINDFLQPGGQPRPYGGVGIENVKQRLLLYYPDKHELSIGSNDNTYTVALKLSFK